MILVYACVLAGACLAQEQKSLKEIFKEKFLIGAALNDAQCSGHDARGAALVVSQFNTITPENVLKWEHVHPQPDVYAFDASDRYVDFGGKNGLFVVGHTLVWHSQTPNWVFENAEGKPLDRKSLLKRMRDHIQTVMGRYKGRIKGWDVVNEALNEDGSLRQSPWLKIIGEDYIARAFQFAHKADPRAKLYYNDYSLENVPKRQGAIALIKKLQSQGIPIAGVGLQGHYLMEWPGPGLLDSTIIAFKKLGVKVMMTELDIDILPHPTREQSAEISRNFEYQEKLNPYKNGLPDSMQNALARRYAELFAVFLHDGVSRVTFWGVCDGDSWLNGYPIHGRTSHPLLFDRAWKPKPAFDAVIQTAHH